MDAAKVMYGSLKNRNNEQLMDKYRIMVTILVSSCSLTVREAH